MLQPQRFQRYQDRVKSYIATGKFGIMFDKGFSGAGNAAALAEQNCISRPGHIAAFFHFNKTSVCFFRIIISTSPAEVPRPVT